MFILSNFSNEFLLFMYFFNKLNHFYCFREYIDYIKIYLNHENLIKENP